MAPKSSVRRLGLSRPQNQSMSQRCGFFNVPSWVMAFQPGLTGWVGSRDGSPGLGAGCEGDDQGHVSSSWRGTPEEPRGCWWMDNETCFQQSMHFLPMLEPNSHVGRVLIPLTSDTCGRIGLWAGTKPRVWERKASDIFCKGWWAVRRTRPWSVGLQIQINFHQKKKKNRNSTGSCWKHNLTAVQRQGYQFSVGQKPPWEGGA